MSQISHPSSTSYRFAVPAATQAQLQSPHHGWDNCQNLYLLLHQYVPRDAIESAKAADSDSTGSVKGEWLAMLAERSSSSSLFDQELCQSWLRDWQALTSARQAISFAARTVARLVVGLGGQNALETDLRVHPLYGIPYLPASAVKGLTSAYVAVELLAEAAHNRELRATVERIFGEQDHAGSIIFFDAPPAVGLRLDLDIVNPHYPDYYRDTTYQKPPSDDQGPVPIPFLTVAASSVFHFAVAPRPGVAAENDVEIALAWLQQALRDYGLGAKTNSGYGRFKVI